MGQFQIPIENFYLIIRIYIIFNFNNYGHSKVLEQCKKMLAYDHLAVGVCADEDMIKEKSRSIMIAEERAEEVILNCPWLINLDYLDKLD